VSVLISIVPVGVFDFSVTIEVAGFVYISVSLGKSTVFVFSTAKLGAGVMLHPATKQKMNIWIEKAVRLILDFTYTSKGLNLAARLRY
jgi:hypothetical protein